MKIAYLILCHTDPTHVARLALKLTADAPGCSVFVHVDAKAPARDDFQARLRGLERVTLVADPVDVWWGGASAIDATHLLLHEAMAADAFDRFVLLQGADYPLMSNDAIRCFFEAHPDTEFIRACNATRGTTRKVHIRTRHVLFYDRPNVVTKVTNKLTRILDLKLRDGRIRTSNGPWDLYWGCAQFALTRAAVAHVLEMQPQTGLRKQFGAIFPADELYFHTLIFNSGFAARTTHGRAEGTIGDLGDARNLHYFEYPSLIRIFDANDHALLAARPEMFVRKVGTTASTGLLDLIDASHCRLEDRP